MLTIALMFLAFDRTDGTLVNASAYVVESTAAQPDIATEDKIETEFAVKDIKDIIIQAGYKVL